MRVVLVLDERFAWCEHEMLQRLVIGLASEGVAAVITQVGSGGMSFFAETLGTLLPLQRRLPGPLARFSDEVVDRALRDHGVASFDLVHAFGGEAWSIASALAARRGVPLAVEVWRSDLVERARGVRDAARRRSATAGAGHRVLFFAPDAGVEEELRREGLAAQVRTAPWGVYTDAAPRGPRRAGRAPSVVLAGRGRFGSSFVEAFDGAMDVMAEREDMLAFVEADVALRLGLWSRAKSRGVRGRVTLLPSVEASRDAALAADLLIYPDARGERRSLLLDAMATGTPVLAAADPRMPWIEDGVTARVVPERRREAWADACRGLLDDASARDRLCGSAHAYARERHRVSAHVAAVLDGYESASREPAAAAASA